MAILGAVAVICVVVIAVEVIDHYSVNYSRTNSSATYNPDPFASENQKKQGREKRKEKEG